MSLTMIMPLLVAAVMVLVFVMSMRYAEQHERILVMRRGRVLDKTRGPGLFFVIPFGVERITRIDTRVTRHE